MTTSLCSLALGSEWGCEATVPLAAAGNTCWYRPALREEVRDSGLG